MRSIKIIITLLILVTLGLVVGSNLSVLMPIVVLNQPTVALPIGVWLIISIALGILSSSTIQLLLFLQRRTLTKKVRQLQTRLQEQDEDIFTYTSSADNQPAAEPVETIPMPRNRFSFRRKQAPTPPESNFTSPRSPQPIEVDDANDWEDEPAPNHQLDWDEAPPTRQQNASSTTRAKAYSNPRPPDRVDYRSTQNREPEPARTDEVYDADFRLIQPPYKQPVAEEFEDIDEEELEYDQEEFESPVNAPEPKFTNKSNLAEEDWGFDFDDEAEEVRTTKSKPRRA
jgi:hypothetical protein